MWNWGHIFTEAKRIVSSVDSIEKAVAECVSVARRSPQIFDESDYWQRVEHHDFRPAFELVSKWASDALSRLRNGQSWRLVILDLGDCPEIFFPYVPGAQNDVSEEKLLKLFSDPLIQAEEFGQCFREEGDDSLDRFFDEREELTDNHVRELNDAVLTWNGFDYHGKNGEFLWLVIGTFAFLQQAQTGEWRKQGNTENGRLHIVAGFEELFAHFATVQ